MVGTLSGVATSLGLGVMQISSGLDSAGIIENPGILEQIVIIVVIAVTLIDSLSLGAFLNRGLYLTAALFGLYLVLIIIGYRAWRRSMYESSP